MKRLEFQGPIQIVSQNDGTGREGKTTNVHLPEEYFALTLFCGCRRFRSKDPFRMRDVLLEHFVLTYNFGGFEGSLSFLDKHPFIRCSASMTMNLI